MSAESAYLSTFSAETEAKIGRPPLTTVSLSQTASQLQILLSNHNQLWAVTRDNCCQTLPHVTTAN